MEDSDKEKVENYPTLVRYSNPIMVVKHDKRGYHIPDPSELRRPLNVGSIMDARRETEEILNSILPPRCWEQDGQIWKQAVSSTPATRQDVISLQETLDTRLHQTQARETGICPIRRELYSQCFDEIIRQVTINCSERGLLLLRIRDEIAMSIEAYETLYCSSVAFGMRKALQSHEEKEILRDRVKLIENEKDSLEDSMVTVQLKHEQAERRNMELRLSEEKKCAEEIAYLKKTNSQLKSQLEGITAPKK